mgnify:CR=1 FL=1
MKARKKVMVMKGLSCKKRPSAAQRKKLNQRNWNEEENTKI